MPDAELVQAVTDTALRLISASRSGDVDAAEIAQEIGRPADDVDLHYAFKEAERRGDLEATGWHGDLGLPYSVRLPPGR